MTAFALKIYNKLMPPVQPRIDVDQQADQLSADYSVSQVRPDYPDLGWRGPVGVENLFSDHAVNFLFRLPQVQGPTGYLNCASNIFATVLAGATETPAHYVGVDALDPLFQKYFQEVQPPLQIVDIVRYIIPGNFHVFVYAGTDQQTGERIGFTKNGKELGIFTFMKFDDIHRLYEPFTISAVKYYRLVHAMPANLFDQFPAVPLMTDAAHTASRVVVLPEINKIIAEQLSPSDVPTLRGNF